MQSLRQAGYENVEYLKGSIEAEELQHKLANVHFLGIRSRTQLTEAVFAAAPKLLAVGGFPGRL